MKKIKYNDVGFKDSFIDRARDGRKKSDAKKEGQYGPKYIRNPDKLKSTMDPSAPKISKEEYVRSGQRKEKRAHTIGSVIGSLVIPSIYALDKKR